MKRPSNHVPRDVVTFVNGAVHDMSYTVHCLVKNNRAVVVQTTFLPHSLAYPRRVQGSEWAPADTFDYFRAVNDALNNLQAILNCIKFGAENWVYVNQTADGGYQVTQRRKSFRHLITCELWAPFISLHEIEITGWNVFDMAKGYWNNLPVDIYYGWDETTMATVNQTMHAAKAVRGLDITQEVYGHLLDDEGEVIGLVIEATTGRPVELCDRTLLYEAMAKLHRHYCTFPSVGDNTLISAGKVRFASLPYIFYHPPAKRHDFEKEAEKDWIYLERLFATLEEGIVPLAHISLYSSEPVTLFQTPSPYHAFPLTTYFDVCLEGELYGNDDDEYDSVRRPILKGNQADVMAAIQSVQCAIGARLEPFSIVDYERHLSILQEARLQARVPPRKGRAQRRSRLNANPTHPYTGRSAYTRTSPRMILYHDSDCTSESGQSRFEEVF